MTTLEYIRQLIDESLKEAEQPTTTAKEWSHAIKTYYNLGQIIKLTRAKPSEENANLFLEVLNGLTKEILINRTYRKNKN